MLAACSLCHARLFPCLVSAASVLSRAVLSLWRPFLYECLNESWPQLLLFTLCSIPLCSSCSQKPVSFFALESASCYSPSSACPAPEPPAPTTVAGVGVAHRCLFGAPPPLHRARGQHFPSYLHPNQSVRGICGNSRMLPLLPLVYP